MTAGLVVTGGEGFLGWHVRVLARALGRPDPAIVRTDDDPTALAAQLDGAELVIHLAGVNRGTPAEVTAGNVTPAESLARALRLCVTPPKTVVFANSIQAGNGTPYGESKAAAAHLLAEATQWIGSALIDVPLPNLFGEHGRPHYNSVIATFCSVLAEGGRPEVHDDRSMELLHATDAAALLIGATIGPDPVPAPVRRSVSQLADQLGHFATVYGQGEIPALPDRFDVRLFNTYRSFCFPGHAPVRLPHHTDPRGELVETVKTHGGGGQTFCSTTRPGVTRGEHFHLAKVERFVVVRGEAVISLRRVLHDEVIRFSVSGADPVAIDMPSMWVHNITNVGAGELLTLFYANELFDPARSDTYPEPVRPR